MKITYAKLKDGTWGLRVPGEIAPGTSATVTKRDGTTKTEIVGALEVSFGTISLYRIAGAARPSFNSASTPKRTDGERTDGGPRGFKACYMCGSYYCDGARGGLCDDD